MSLFSEMFDEVDGQGEVEEVEFEDCEALRETERAVLVRFKNKNEKWVPKSQLSSESEVRRVGSKGMLLVSEWIAERWAEEKQTEKEAPVAVANVKVMRETDKALMIEVDGDDDAPGIWIPKTQLHEDSEVKGDGDCGTMLISAWIAEQKGLKGETKKKLQRSFDKATKKPPAEAPKAETDDDSDIPF